MDSFSESFFYLYTAAVLGHPKARTDYAILYLQSGLLPSKLILEKALNGDEKTNGSFSFLKYLAPDINHFLNTGNGKMDVTEFFSERVQGESLL